MSEALDARSWSVQLKKISDVIIQYDTVIQDERSISMRAASGDVRADAAFKEPRSRTDAVFRDVGALAKTTVKLNPDATEQAAAAFAELTSKLPTIRQQVDRNQISVTEVDSYYSGLSQLVVSTLEGSSRTSSDAKVSAGLINAANTFSVVDLQTRATALAAAGTATNGRMSAADRAKLARVVGSYHELLELQVPRMTADQRVRYEALVGGDPWRMTTLGEDRLVQQGTLPVRASEWLNSSGQVSTGLLDVAATQFRQAAKLSLDNAQSQLIWAAAVGAGVLVLSFAAFLIAIRLANRLVRRLQVLRTKTMDLAERVLPSLVQRVHDGELIDIEAEISGLDDSHDEIGQVARAFEAAERTAVAAAAAEAKTRKGVNKVFLDIAHRSQVLVHRQLKVLDTAEARQNDPEHLELLFMLDHLVTRARRNAENLVVLGGGQPGRKWREPVALEAVVRSAVSETEDLTRVSAVRLPEVGVIAGAVADLSHLLAELVDNATAFSPPDAPVAIRGNLVGNGVVLEIIDQGLGLSFEQRTVLNGTLSSPPDFQAMALAEKRHLGLFVVGQLAKRHGIVVSLHDSPYGGITAIVLMPKALIATSEGPDQAPQDLKSVQPTGRRHRLPEFVPQAVPEQVPGIASARDRHPHDWPVLEASTTATESASPDGPPTPSGRRRAALPRRERQANLAPELRPDSRHSKPAPEAPSRLLRDPQQARDSMASFQRGTLRGRSPEQPDEAR